MKVVLNTSVSFGNFGGVAPLRAVELPEELVKPFLNNGVAVELNENVVNGAKILFPVSQEFLPKEKPKKRTTKKTE